MTVTISLAVLALIAFSSIAFVLTTIFCHKSGMFDGSDTYGISAMFTLLFYAVMWVTPTLLAWAVWATWFKG